MSSEYTTLDISQDAKAFADSRFGKHYLKRLRDLERDALMKTKSLEYSDNFRAHMGTRAAAYSDEIEYFKIAQMVQSNPSLIQRLREKGRKRKEAEPTV